MNTLESFSVFSMNEVENLNPYCVNALEKDITYLTAFDTNRLLAGFRETAGLDTKGAKRYEGWESTLIGGHSIGHYLSAIAQGYANPGVCAEDKKKIYDIIVTLIDGLLECQANSKGKKNFLFGANIIDPENVEIQFDNVEANRTNIITESWVPWYTMHKILAGVLDTYKITGYKPALTLAKQIGDWTYDRATSWDEATAAQVIRIEYGGMNEVLYELYALTTMEKYAVAAHFFDSPELFERVNAGGADALNNHHANTTIPKFIGALHRYITCHGKTIAGEKIDASRYFDYAKNFWDMVVEKHTYITGGNSEWEHFGKDFILDKERTNCNCETCNIYNMLKFSRTLFCLTGEKKYLDYYENAFYNTILSSQNPETGMTTYFQPMSTGYFKVFGERFNKFWCCTGTGMENFTKLNDSIYFKTNSDIIVNLYETSKLIWKEKNVILQMKADLLSSGKVEISISEIPDAQDAAFSTCPSRLPGNATTNLPHVKRLSVGLMLRIPTWASAQPAISINGKEYLYEVRNGFALLPAGLEYGTKILITLPMKIAAFSLPDNKRSIAIKYGPTVLSANLGTENMATTTTGMMVTIPAEKIGNWDKIVLRDEVSVNDLINNPEKYFVMNESDNKISDSAISGNVSFTLSINGLVFAPHFKRYKERYGIYFEIKTEVEVAEEKKAKELALLDKPEGKVIDTVQPGYGQYENDELHRMFDWGGSVGSTDNGTTRYAKSGGSFTYHMCVSDTADNYLSLTFLKEDNGKSLKISSGDEVFYEDVLSYDGDEDTYEIRVKVPETVAKAAQTVTANGEVRKVIPLTFKGSQGAQSARLFGFVYMMNY